MGAGHLINMVHCRRLVEPNGSQAALVEFPVPSAINSIKALVDLWNREMEKVKDTIVPKCTSHLMELKWPCDLLGSYK